MNISPISTKKKIVYVDGVFDLTHYGHYNLFKQKSLRLFFITILFLLFTGYEMFSYHPHQNVYFNFLAGKNIHTRFENDYWGSSIRELIKNSKFNESEIIKISACGINPKIAKRYFIKKGYSNIELVHPDESKYVIMTNRTVLDDKTGKISNCFNLFKGDAIFEVTRNKLLLSTIRKIN